MAGINKRVKACLALFGVALFAVVGLSLPDIAAGQEKVIITDALGRSVSIPAKVERLIPLGGAMRFVLYGQCLDTVVGVEAIEQKPVETGRLYGLAVQEKAKTLPAVSEGGPGGKFPDFEKAIAVNADVILTVGFDNAQVETIQQKTGIPVVVLNAGATAALDLKQTRESIRMLGRITGRTERADALVDFIDQAEKDLNDRTASIPARPKAYVGAVGFRGKHGITSTETFYAPLCWIHGDNVANEIGKPGHNFIDQEKILLWNPEVIFLDAGGMDKVQEDYGKNPEYYRMLKAVQAERVFVVPPYNFYFTNIEIALANAYFMGKTMYPDKFTDIDPAVKADAIFEFFIGLKAYAGLQKEHFGFGQAVFAKDGLTVR